ncbi:MAG: rhomboid family intramembrane serine protease, partial [Chroococcales cyanobacterium]
MTLNQILIWTVGISCLAFFLRAIRMPNNTGWIVVSSSIFIVTGTLAYFVRDWAGWVGISLWLVFILIPMLGFARANRLVYQQRYQQAQSLLRGLRWLHPADGWWEQPQLVQALEKGQQGNMTEALGILNDLRASETALGRNATVLLYSMAADWEGCRRWIESSIPSKLLLRESNLIVYYLRSLGETGDINELLREYERHRPSLESIENTSTLNIVRMFAFAFSGQTALVQQLLEPGMELYSAKVKTFWLATAQLVRGKETEAIASLSALQSRSSVALRRAIDWRLSNRSRIQKPKLTPLSWHILSEIQTEMRHERRYGGAMRFTPHKAYATYTLVGLNLIAFALEMALGGTENIVTLQRLGALVPQLVLEGEVWRLITANFLHFGWLHLTMNMLGLYFLGPFVELTFGKGRYLLIYLIS